MIFYILLGLPLLFIGLFGLLRVLPDSWSALTHWERAEFCGALALCLAAGSILIVLGILQ